MQEAGVQAGDEIVEINGNKINSKKDINKIMENSNGEELNISIQRNGVIINYLLKPTEVISKATGMYLDEKCKIIMVEKGSSSEKYGVRENDKLIKINGLEVNGDREKAIEEITRKGINIMLLTIKRGNEEINIELTPDYISNYYIGANFKLAEDNFINRSINGGIETVEFVKSIIDNLKQLISGNVGINQMMGPVGISEVVSKTNGFSEFFQMMALISLSLGVTNLLPIPALDGGKFLILMIEVIRKKPLKEKTEINIQLLGFSILIALAIYITYNDVIRIF